MMGNNEVSFDVDENRFYFRVGGFLICNNCLICEKFDDGISAFYCLPGGKVELGERSDHAITREIEEELGLKTCRGNLCLAEKVDSSLGAKHTMKYASIILWMLHRSLEGIRCRDSNHFNGFR